jgi:hypothetical protein
MAFQTCSICSRPGNARQLVDAMLDKKVAMVKIAVETGFTKSSIGRHSLKCRPRAAIQQVRNSQFDPLQQQVFVEMPDGEIIRWARPWGFHGERSELPGARDVVIHVEFEKFKPANAPNPGALILAAYDEALAEDAQRFPKTAEENPDRPVEPPTNATAGS